jgi:hypothetical protein
VTTTIQDGNIDNTYSQPNQGYNSNDNPTHSPDKRKHKVINTKTIQVIRIPDNNLSENIDYTSQV